MNFGTFANKVRGFYQRKSSSWLAQNRMPLQAPGPLISFTFDDFPVTAATVGAAALEEHGARGTYYVSLGLAGRTGPVGQYFADADVLDLQGRGHELGCHTYDHFHAWNTPAGRYAESLEKNARRLQELIPGAKFLSHSYPIGYPRPGSKRTCGRLFESSRGGGQRPNVADTDANNLAACFIEKLRHDPTQLFRMIDATVAQRGWLILATHDISDTPSPFGCSPALFRDLVAYAAHSPARLVTVAQGMKLICGQTVETT